MHGTNGNNGAQMSKHIAGLTGLSIGFSEMRDLNSAPGASGVILHWMIICLHMRAYSDWPDSLHAG